MTVYLCLFADENVFATSAQLAPAAKKHFSTQSCFPRLCAATKIFAHKQCGMFLKRKSYEEYSEYFFESQEKIDYVRFFLLLARVKFKEG